MEYCRNLILREGDVPYLLAPNLADTGLVRHAFSTRQGGVSEGPYATLNLGLHVGDSDAAVHENRRRFWEACGMSLERTVIARQEHTATVACVTAAEAGRGALIQAEALPATDALVTDVPGLVLAAFFADCVPILLLDPVHRAVGVVHAGWRGTVAGIVGNAVERMTAAYGTKPGDCLAAIGPAIGPEEYRVDAKVMDPLRAAFPDWAEFTALAGEGEWQLDLREANRRALLRSGLAPAGITLASVSTAADTELFFSHRASPKGTGRLAALITLT